MWGLWGAITILTGDDFELTLATMCNRAGLMDFRASLRVIPASMTSGSLRKSVNLPKNQLLTYMLLQPPCVVCPGVFSRPVGMTSLQHG